MTGTHLEPATPAVTTPTFAELFARQEAAKDAYNAACAAGPMPDGGPLERAFLADLDAVTRADPETPTDLANLVDLLVGGGGAMWEHQETHLRASARRIAAKAASPVPFLWEALGGDLTLGAGGRLWHGQPEAWTLSEVPNLPDAKPHERFQSSDEWTGALKLLTYLFGRMSEAERAEVRAAVLARQTPEVAR